MASSSDLLQLVTRAKIETAWSPPIVIDDPFADNAAPNPLLQLLKPRITLDVAIGSGKSVVIAPYGDPEPSRWPLVKAGLVVTGIAGAFLLVRALTRRRRRRR